MRGWIRRVWYRDVRKEAAFRATEERMKSIVDNVLDGIVTIDSSGTIESVNPAIERMFGYSKLELLGQTVAVFMSEHDRARAGDYIERYMQTGETHVIGNGREVVARRRDGSLFPLDLTVAEFQVEGKRHFAGVLRDITERKRTDAATAYLAAIVDSSDDAIIGKNLDGKITSWNRGAERMFGYTADEIVGRSILTLIPEDYRHEELVIIERLKSGQSEKHLETVRLTKGGRRIDVSLSICPIRDASGRIFGASKIARDITESKKAIRALAEREEQLRKSEQMLRHSQRMAHLGSWEMDLGNPPDFTKAALRWSDESYRILGYEPQEFPASWERFMVAVHPEDRERVTETVSQALRENGPYSIEHRVFRPDGVERFVFEWGEIVTNEAGVAVRMLGTCQDVTEQHWAELSLRNYAGLMEHLRAIDLAILSSRSPEEIAKVALEHLARHAAYRTALIAVHGAEVEEFEVLASDGLLREWHQAGSRLTSEISSAAKSNASVNSLEWAHDSLSADSLTSELINRLQSVGMESFVLQPLRDSGRQVGFLLLGSDRTRAFSAVHIEAARELANHVAIAVRQARLFEQVESARSRLEELTRRLIRAQEDERRHIARELHDEIGQTLTAVKIHLQLIDEHGLRPVDARLQRYECIGFIDRTLMQIRNISLNLRPLLLDDFGLVSALRSYVNQQARIGGFTPKFEVDPPDTDFRLEPELETACFRLTQEALTNVVRHASASYVQIDLRLREHELRVRVRDDGIGFDLAEARSRAAAGTSLGLMGMQERVSLVGGRFVIGSKPGEGTEVSARFPLHPEPGSGS